MSLPLLGGSGSLSEETGRFTSSKGYSFKAPDGWVLWSGDFDASEMAKLPKKVREQVRPDQVDVMLMDDTPEVANSNFNDNLNVVVVAGKVDTGEAGVKQLKGELMAQYGSIFSNFVAESFEPVTAGKHKAVHLVSTYELNDRKLYMEQYFVPGKTKSVSLTCTAAQERRARMQTTCKAVANSIAFK